MVIFRTKLIGPGVYGEGASFVTTKAQSESLGDQDEILVSGTIDGIRFEGTFISIGDGTHYINLDRKMLTEAQVNVGDEMIVWAEAIPSTGTIELPDDLREALDSDPEANDIFNALPPSHRRGNIEYVEGAKMSDTRMARIKRTIEKLKE